MEVSSQASISDVVRMGEENQVTAAGSQRTINIGNLNEDELLNIIRGYINSMGAFAQKKQECTQRVKGGNREHEQGHGSIHESEEVAEG